VAGLGVAPAYLHATGGPERNAWRWLARMRGQLAFWRSLDHQPSLPPAAAPHAAIPFTRQSVLRATLAGLCRDAPGPRVCAAFQQRRQRGFM
jgi:hypothetical protein